MGRAISEALAALPEHVRRAAGAEAFKGPRSSPAASSTPGGGNVRRRGRSKLQASYALHLAARQDLGEVLDFHEEAVRLRLADRTWYWPDFLVHLADGSVELHEVKGHREDDARAKLKIAGEMHPWATFVEVRHRKGAWIFERIPGPRSTR